MLNMSGSLSWYKVVARVRMHKRVVELEKYPVQSKVPQVQRPVCVQLPMCGRDMGVGS